MNFRATFTCEKNLPERIAGHPRDYVLCGSPTADTCYTVWSPVNIRGVRRKGQVALGSGKLKVSVETEELLYTTYRRSDRKIVPAWYRPKYSPRLTNAQLPWLRTMQRRIPSLLPWSTPNPKPTQSTLPVSKLTMAVPDSCKLWFRLL